MTRAALHMGPPICAPADRARYTPLRVAFPRRRAERAIDQHPRAAHRFPSFRFRVEGAIIYRLAYRVTKEPAVGIYRAE